MVLTLLRDQLTHSRRARDTVRSAVIGCLSWIFVGAACSEEPPSTTPYRPSVSTPAALSAPGWLEVEAGLQSTKADDPSRRDSVPYSLKLAFTPDWGVRLGGDAMIRQRNSDGVLRGGGDTNIVVKRRFAVDEKSAFGMELGVKLPTARNGLGSGHSDVGLNGIYSADFAENWHTDVNLLATRLGGIEADASRYQTGWAAALSCTLSDRWGAVGELSGTHQGGIGGTSQALVAASYSFTRGLTMDLGVSKGLSAASGGWSVFSGLTFLAARLF